MKKVAFSTLSPSSIGDGFNTAKNGLSKKKKSSKKDDGDEELSLRFEIKLCHDSSSGDNCPEFSYIDLLNSAEDRQQQQNQLDDPDLIYERAEEERMKDIAKQFETKYAPKRRRKEDYIDKGAGYDENDSFIDNDEAYDELIPSTLTTKYGGFYINCGKLEFRQCSDNEDDEMISEADDDEDSINFKAATKKRKNKSNSFNNSKRRKRVIESDDSKSNDNSRDLDEEEDESESDEESSSGSDSSLDNNQQQTQPQQKPPKKKMNNSGKHVNPTTQIDSIIDSVIKSTNDKQELGRDDPHRISDDLPNGLKEKLNQLKEMKLNQQDKRQRFFSDDINKILLGIDNLIQSNSSFKNKVISWLTSYLQVTRETLLKRIKSSKRTSEELKLKQNVAKLRVEVSYLIEEHEEKFEARKNGLNVSDAAEKEFKFNDKIKELLKKILNSKRILVELDNIKGKLEEDNITNYFNNEIRNIWPADWITNQVLLKTAGFISKYNQTSDTNKTSVSVINNKKTQQNSNNVNNQALNLNVPKTSQQQQQPSPLLPTTNNGTNHIGSSSKVNNKHSQQAKDLSIDKSSSSKHDHNNKSESLLANKKQHNESKSNSHHHHSSKHHHHSDSVNSIINQQIKSYRNEIASAENLQQQYSIDKLTQLDQLSASQLQNLTLMQQLMKDQKQAKKLQQQQQFANQQQKSISSQPKNSSSPFDKAQNLTNLVAAHSSHNSTSSAMNNSINRHHSTSNHNSIATKKYLEQQMQKQMLSQSTPNNSNKTIASSSQAPINKSPLECDYKFEKKIQQSLIEESTKINQYQRSNSLSNSNSMTAAVPKPAHSNSTPASSQQNAANLSGLYNKQIMQQIAIQQLMGYMQQSGNYISGHDRKSSNNDLNSSTSSVNSFNYGNNYTGNNPTNQLQSQQQQIVNSKFNSGQVYVSNSNSLANVASTTVSNSSLITNSLISNSAQLANPNFKAQQQQTNSTKPEIKMQSEFDVNSMISNRYHSSPNQLNTASLGQISYQNSTELVNHPLNSGSPTAAAAVLQQQQPNTASSIYPDYMNLTSQQQLYQRTIQQRQDGNY